MFKLHPIPDTSYDCPHCGIPLDVKGWYIPGMRNLADLKCLKCGREYYGDLLAGQAIFSPMLLEKENGVVHDSHGVKWFADWLHDSYACRVSSAVRFTVEEFKPAKDAILLNCIDTLYGHSLLKLLNAQYYLDRYPERGLIVMIQKNFRWMIPEGVAAIWTVDLPLKRGTEWNDWLAAEIKRLIGTMDSCWLSIAYSHPHSRDYNIERFTRVKPFSGKEWELTKNNPAVTFVWRDDRLWCNDLIDTVIQILKRRKLDSPCMKVAAYVQKRRVIRLAMAIRRAFPGVKFAITGVGRPGGFPDWISDLRTTKIDRDTELRWCEQYALSHLVIGVHGSNMLLPSAHSAAVMELVPPDRWGNILQDILFRDTDGREMLFNYRLVPCSIGPDEVANNVVSMLKLHDIALYLMGQKHCRHDPDDARTIHRKWRLI